MLLNLGICKVERSQGLIGFGIFYNMYEPLIDSNISPYQNIFTSPNKNKFHSKI